MTYIPNQKIATVYDNTTTQALTGTLSRFQTVSNPYCFFSSTTTHSLGNTLFHICTVLTNDSDTVIPRSTVWLSSENNRIGASLSHKKDAIQPPVTCLTSTNQPISLNAISIDTGDFTAVGALNLIVFRLKD